MFFKLQTPASGFPGVMDDLVFSGAGSGCNNGDDEDECPPLQESGSGDDDLITPVFVPPTRPPVTIKPPHKNSNNQEGGKPCDDEDCFPGSGSGEVTEESSITSIATGNILFTLLESFFISRLDMMENYNNNNSLCRTKFLKRISKVWGIFIV